MIKQQTKQQYDFKRKSNFYDSNEGTIFLIDIKLSVRSLSGGFVE